jgi:tellurite resistance protein TerC
MPNALLHQWIVFAATIAAALLLDLVVFHRQAHPVSLKEALAESAGWIGLSLLFGLWIYLSRGSQPAVEFITGYVVEKSLSLDNVFLFLVIFRAFRVESRLHHKVLFYGVLGALVLRAIFVFAGVALLQAFHSTLYVFGAILLVTGARMLGPAQRGAHPERNWLVRLASRFLPVTAEYQGDRFLVRQGSRLYATPLLLALVAVEATDIVFAVDSVPAVLAITRDMFVVYSSNAFAILGLRSLYFAMAGILPRFRFLHQALAAILLFVGAKMLLSERLRVPTPISLLTLALILFVAILVSVAWPAKESRTN